MHRRDFAFSLICLLLASMTVHVIGVYPISPVKAISSTPTFLLGSSGPLDPLVLKLQTLTTSLTLLPTISDLALVGDGSVIFIDGAWLESASSLDPTVLSLVLSTVLQGVPTVVVRGNPAILGNSVTGLIRLRAPDLPLIAEGLRITGALPDGTRQGETFQVASGFDYAVEREFAWAEQQFVQAGGSTLAAASKTTLKPFQLASTSETTTTQTDPPDWEFIIKVIFSTGDSFEPYGRVTTTFSLFRLRNDGTDTYKWFNMFMELTIEPGIAIYNSGFRTSDEMDRVRVDPDTNLLVDHGPRLFATEGPDVISYNIGVTEPFDGAAVTASQAQSYPLKHTTVTDFSTDTVVSWLHDIDSRADSGKLTFTIIPGWTDRVLENEQMFILGDFTSRFDRLQGNTIVETVPRTLSLIVQGG